MRDRLRIMGYWTVIVLCIIALAALVTSCRTVYVDRPVTHTEIEYRDRVDSIAVHDSVYIKETVKGDTVRVVEYRFRDRFRYIYSTDTVAVRDTVQVVRTEVVEKTVAQMNGFQKFFFYSGMFLLLLLVLYVMIKIRCGIVGKNL